MPTTIPSPPQLSLRQILAVCGNLGVRAGDILREVHEQRLNTGGSNAGLQVVDKGAAQVGEESGLAPARKNRDEEVEQQEDDEDEEDIVQQALDREQDMDERIRLDWWPSDPTMDQVIETKRISIWIDPLDATREYTEGRVEFCTVLIGIAVNGRATAGVMIEPFSAIKDEGPICWWGCKSLGCFRTVINSNQSTKIAFPPSSSRPHEVVRIAVSRSRAGGVVQQFTQRYTNFLEFHNINFNIAFSGGCGHKILQVLKGVADFYPFPCSGTSMWDSCAGDALLDSAGGKLTDRQGRRLVFDPASKSYENPHGLLASNDERICRFASESIAACLEFTRNLRYEFLSNDLLARTLNESAVAYYETPSSTLVHHKHAGLVEFDLVATTASGTKRKLRFRRFDPTALKPETQPELVFVLAKRAAEAHFFEQILPELSQMAAAPTFAHRVVSLERTANRRPATVADVLRKDHAFNKLFLQSAAYVCMFEDCAVDNAGLDSFAAEVEFLRNFHEAFAARPDLMSKMELDGWRSERNMFQLATVTPPATVPSASPKRARESGVSALLERMNKHEIGRSASQPKSTRRAVIRGAWKESPKSLMDMAYCTVANAEEDAYMLDLAHLYLIRGSTSSNVVQVIRQRYFRGKVEECAVAKRVKTALFLHLRRLLASRLFVELFDDVNAQQRCLRIAEVLCRELDESRAGELNGTALDCFSVSLAKM